ILPVVSILVVGSLILGATTLEEFGIALFVGLLVGAYSSIFVATPIVVWLKERQPQYRELRERLGRRPGEVVLPTVAEVSAGAALAGTSPSGGGATADGAARPKQAAPRPATSTVI